LTLLENRFVNEREEFQAKVAGLEDQLSSDQKSSVERLDALVKEVKAKEVALQERVEEHAAYCKLTDTKLAEFSTAVTAKEDEMKSLLEQHQAELLEKYEMSSEELAKVTKANEEQLARLNSQIDVLTTDKHGLESELQLLQDKLTSESESLAQLKKEMTELLLAKEETEHQLEDLRCATTTETEQMINLRDEQIAALKSALSDKDHSLSLLTAALSQAYREDVDSSSHTAVNSSTDAEVLDVGSGDAGHVPPEVCGDQLSCTQNYDIQMMVHQINSLAEANVVLREKIGRLEADLSQIRQTDVKPIHESHQPEFFTPLQQPPTESHSTG